MESLKIRTGRVKLQVLDDTGEVRGIFSFNPTDIESAKQMVAIQNEFTDKSKEFEARSKVCTEPKEQIKLLDEIVTYFKGMIDRCFGEGSSDILFGSDKSLEMFFDFFEGITPYYEKASKDRMSKYTQLKK